MTKIRRLKIQKNPGIMSGHRLTNFFNNFFLSLFKLSPLLLSVLLGSDMGVWLEEKWRLKTSTLIS